MTIECSRSVHSIALGILPSLLPLSFAGQSLVPANAFTKLFSSNPCFIHAQIFNTLAIAPRISDMNPAIFSLNQAGILDNLPETSSIVTRGRIVDCAGNAPAGMIISSVYGANRHPSRKSTTRFCEWREEAVTADQKSRLQKMIFADGERRKGEEHGFLRILYRTGI